MQDTAGATGGDLSIKKRKGGPSVSNKLQYYSCMYYNIIVWYLYCIGQVIMFCTAVYCILLLYCIVAWIRYLCMVCTVYININNINIQYSIIGLPTLLSYSPSVQVDLSRILSQPLE